MLKSSTSQTFYLIDGGMATTLEANNVKLHPTLWSGGAVIESPKAVENVHKEFLSAGANLHLTASYQLSLQGLAKLNYTEEQAKMFLLKSIDCAKQALSSNTASIAASIGPYGAHLCDGSEYRGNYGLAVDALIKFHEKKFILFSHSEADLIVFETIPCLEELRAITKLSEKTTKPLWVSVNCRNETELASGEPLKEVARIIQDNQNISFIGVNCVSPHLVSSHIRILKDNCDKPVLVYPNIGQEWDATKRIWVGSETKSTFLKYVEEWLELRVNGIGGCCGVNPVLIREICAFVGAKKPVRN